MKAKAREWSGLKTVAAIVLGALAGTLISVLMLTAAAAQQPQPREIGRVEGTGNGGGSWSFTLYAENGSLCSGEWRRTVYRQSAPTLEVEGCWIDHEGQVRLLFTDGDRYVIPRKAFRDGSV